MLALTERARPGVPWGQPGCASERSGKAEDWGQIVTAHGDRHVKPRSHDPADLPPASHKNLQRQRHLQPPRVLSLEGINKHSGGVSDARLKAGSEVAGAKTVSVPHAGLPPSPGQDGTGPA